MVEESAEDKVKAKKKAVIKSIVSWIGIIVVVCIVSYFVFIYEGSLFGDREEISIVEPADVELYRFSALADWVPVKNETLNVEIWVINTGDVIAREISVFVRCRNQNGTVLFADLLDLTREILNNDETASSTFTVDYRQGDAYIETTIELRSDQSSHSYLKKTEL